MTTKNTPLVIEGYHNGFQEKRHPIHALDSQAKGVIFQHVESKTQVTKTL